MLKIYKLGGTLLKDNNNYNLLEKIIDKEISKNNKIIIIVSAIGRNNDPYATDTLKKYSANLNKIDNNYLLGLGEILSSLITANNLSKYNPKVVRYNKIGIRKKNNKYLLNKRYLSKYLEEHNVLIIPGFIVLDEYDNLLTLDRGGSDLSAVLIAKMMNAKEITLFKETGGIMSGDPKVIASSFLIKRISYLDAYKLSKLGAKIIQKDAINLAKENNIKILVKSLYLDEIGSEVFNKSDLNKYIGVSYDDKYIYLIGNVDGNDLNVIISLLNEYNILINKIKLRKEYILIEVISGKRNFAINLIHHKFMNKKVRYSDS